MRAATGMRWRPREPWAPPLQPSWCSAEAGRRKEVSAAPDGREPETNAATDWQWREFYYYPIITLGSEPRWSMLPPWCHFLLSWLETKSGSMGAIMYDVTSIIATASLLFQSVWNTQKDQFFPKMVKKCFGSMHLPEKRSLLYLSMLLRQELFTQNKTEEMGEGEKNLKFSCRLETCCLKFNPSRGQVRMWAADLRKSHVEGERWPHRYKTPFIL